MSLTQSQIEKKLTNEALDELLHLYWTEQGAEKRRDLHLMASAIPFCRTRLFGFWICVAVLVTWDEPFERAIGTHRSIVSIGMYF